MNSSTCGCPPFLVANRLPIRGRRAGVALVLVLSFLVLITILVVAFFTSVTTELSNAKSYADGVTTRQLSEVAVQTVTGAIRDATYRADSGNRIAAWASQPGMIRTYDGNGAPLAYYKLYSSNNMVVSKDQIATFNYQDSDLKSSSGASIKDWANQSAIFTDLNSPKRGVYPILNPAAGDPTNANAVPGFKIDGTSAKSPVVTAGNAAPMPVRWIYMLRDGTLTTPDSVDAAGKTASWTGAATYNQPSASNPIVGRLAFWTDDETCKVNVNTAAEGTFWDTPRAYTRYEWDSLASFQAAQHEYQRYPGHPAMTSLSAVFPKLTDKEAIYKMVPRTAGGGSVGGTVLATAALKPPTTRLFAAVDEFLFDPSRVPPSESSTATNPTLTRDEVEQARFFATANSRAPDLNLFGKPRVSMWPITLDNTTGAQLTTPFDKLISFCTTVNGSAFYFQRQEPNDAAKDLPNLEADTGLGRNRRLLRYLHDQTSRPVPGFSSAASATFAGKYPSDQDQILTEMFDYVRCTNLRDSTYDTGSGATYVPWAGQYTKSIKPNEKYYGGTGQVVPIVDSTVSIPGQTAGTHPRGFGRFPTLEQVVLVFIGTKNSLSQDYTNPLVPKPYNPAVAANKIRVQAAAFVQLFDPSQGVVLTKPWCSVTISGMDKFQWSDGTAGSSAAMGFPAAATVNVSDQNYAGATFFGGAMDFTGTYYNNTAYPLISHQTGLTGEAPDFNDTGTFSFSGGDIKVEINSLDATGATLAAVQTITLTVPSMSNCPVPLISPESQTCASLAAPGPYDFSRFLKDTRNPGGRNPGRLNAGGQGAYMLTHNDVVRSVIATPGDIRMIVPRQTITPAQAASLYQPHPNYQSTTNKWAHNLYSGRGWAFYGATGGKIVNLNYPGYTATQYTTNNDLGKTVGDGGQVVIDTNLPPPPTGFTGTYQSDGVTPADWDNGVANLKDGSYINKADEGGVTTVSATGANYENYFGMEYANANDRPGPTFFSPNRMIPSPVMFGSLPTGVWSQKPWQTLLFRPGPAGHPGLGSPLTGPPYSTLPDHLFLDLFTMPVVEPYAISEPMSTAGRVNMNYQIAPFSYFTRDSGIRAVLKSEKLFAVPDMDSGTYKTVGNQETAPPATSTLTYRRDIDLPDTLDQFQARFATGDLFRSPSEICSIDLVPVDATVPVGGVTRASMDLYWRNTASGASKTSHQLAGDNTREKPYANVYPRLTTKSNTYTVHMCVQTLRQVPAVHNTATGWATWIERKDLVTGEYRGSQLIERYLDPGDTTLPDFANPANFDLPADSTKPANLDGYYKFRVLSSKQFSP